jgi:hypothetical protein
MRLVLFTLFSLLTAGCVSTVPYAKRIEEAEHSGVCYVHDEQMKKERLQIAYGLIGFSKEFSEARVSRFPFAERDILGGCVVMTVVDHPELSSPEFGEAYVCSQCTAAKTRWSGDHPKLGSKSKAKEPNQTAQTTPGLRPSVSDL